MREAPEELAVIVVYMTAPDVEELPAEARGKDLVAIVGCYSGRPEDADAVTSPLRAIGDAAFDGSRFVPYVTMQRFFDADYPNGRCYYWKSSYPRGVLVSERAHRTVAAADRCSRMPAASMPSPQRSERAVRACSRSRRLRRRPT